MNNCPHCDGECGSAATYAGQVCVPLNGKVRCIDWCIHQIVAALNAGGVETVACCCGHGKQPGRIDLADGRSLTISHPLKRREWRIGIETSEKGLTRQVVHCLPDTDMVPWHVTDWPNEESTKVATDLAKALNQLEQYRWSIYGTRISDS